ncbi:dimethyl sulfoxide reductase anchor subunit [Pseudoluteimonas lycopersici]|uniref:Dimethyl sulfoxide reductase anchor subunit n=1 Tax=Pseudoluteimonas lycopersici TaxID=1324796 RepID=A0A516V6Y9_9GAMM|nr:DmsC/YnfH family molybdoenzyme membrane anchor subunit [Lysobacter lycopersici]QDQ74273.1 dimethyl sulfoxide reductase anchor subunit [Lysobacter lycopersici]
MNPALSVILFTTLSGTGYGLWLWLGLRIALGPRAYDFEPIGWFFALLLGAVLTTIGIVASLWHLGKPLRVWRAFTQWRTSWMSREGVMAVATLAVAVLMVAPLPIPHEIVQRPLAALLAVCALGTICSTAMIYASLKPIPAWRHPLVLPGYIGFALLTGGLAFAALPQPTPVLRFALPVLLVLTIAMAILKLAYWRAIDAKPLPQTRGDAIGLPNRKPSVFERPHTEANYLTKEMGFVVARKHARKMRVFSLLLFAALPILCIALAIATSRPWPWLDIATLCAICGAFLERWLFFAQAKHLVTLYY